MQKKKDTLQLNRETVRELDSADLQLAAGGQAVTAQVCVSLVPTKCCTGLYPSLNAPCTTDN